MHNEKITEIWCESKKEKISPTASADLGLVYRAFASFHGHNDCDQWPVSGALLHQQKNRGAAGGGQESGGS